MSDKKNSTYQIALDGPAGSGKSTIAKGIAKKLKFTYINSGGLFRCAAIALRDAAIDIKNENEVVKVIDRINISQKGEKMFLNNKDVTKRCFSHDISNFVPVISPIPAIRVLIHETQLNIAKGTNIVIEGRDTTTVIFPNATLKVYVTCDPKIRAQRRYDQSDKQLPFDVVLEDLLRRDEADMTRKISPLRQADDALFLDTTGKSVNYCVDYLCNYFFNRIGKKTNNKPKAKNKKK